MTKFDRIYKQVYKECNDELEGKRKALNKKAKRFIIVWIISVSICMFLSLFFSPYYMVLMVIIILFMICKPVPEEEKNYSLDFKAKVIQSFIKAYSQNLEYNPYCGITPIIYDDGEFEEKYDIYHSEDYIQGMVVEKYKIEMSEVHTEREHSDGDNKWYSTIFHGLFAQVELNKFLEQTIKLRKNSYYKFFDKKERIEMDSGEFENLYDTYSKDKIIAMQLLTSDTMQLLIDFYNKYEIVPEITLKSNFLYIRLDIGNIFEANIIKKALDYNTLKRYYDTINFTLKIIEKILKKIDETEI